MASFLPAFLRCGRFFALFLSSCAAAAPAPARPDPAPIVAAFWDCLETHYAARRYGRDADLVLARKRSESGARLVTELGRRGVEVPPQAYERGLSGIVPYVERFLHERTEDHAIARIEPAAAADPGSFLVVAGVRREERTIALAGREARYGCIAYAAILVPPYDLWRSGGEPPRVWAIGRTILLDRTRADAFARDVAAAAALLFAGERDEARRDAQVLVALLGADDDARAEAAGRAIRALHPSDASRTALGAIRAAGVGAGEPDERLLGRLESLGPDERQRVVKSALEPGGLLDIPNKGR